MNVLQVTKFRKEAIFDYKAAENEAFLHRARQYRVVPHELTYALAVGNCRVQELGEQFRQLVRDTHMPTRAPSKRSKNKTMLRERDATHTCVPSVGPIDDDPLQLMLLLASDSSTPELIRALMEQLLPSLSDLGLVVVARVEGGADQHWFGLVELHAVELEPRHDLVDAVPAHRTDQTYGKEQNAKA